MKPKMYNNNEHGNIADTTKRTITTGITEEESTTYSEKTGISITAETGIEFEAFSASVSGTITKEMGWERSQGVSQFSQDQREVPLETPAFSAAGKWSYGYTIQTRRGTLLAGSLSFQEASYVTATYPNSEEDGDNTPDIG